MMRDYVIQTMDGSVATLKIAMHELVQKSGFDATWLAAEETYTDRQRKTRTTKVSVFPGYLFVAFDADADDDRWKLISSLRGVKRVICAGEKPIAMPMGAVDALKVKFHAGEFKLKPIEGLAEGERVVFEAGPFAGHVGTVTQSKGERVDLLMVELFGGKQKLSARADMVRRVVA